MPTIVLDRPLRWRDIAAIALGENLALSAPAERRIENARAIVEAIVARGLRAYGVSTGVGALADVVVAPSEQRALSRNLLRSHACGVGDMLHAAEVRAIVAAQINNYAHGRSGVRLELVQRLNVLLTESILPDVPAAGSVGYLMHMAHVALVLIGEGAAYVDGERLPGAAALARRGVPALTLEAKEGLSLVNGTACSAGFSAYAMFRAERALDWADAIAAMTFENLHGQPGVFDEETLALRVSPGLAFVGRAMRERLQGSGMLGSPRTQDPLSLRAIPHVHGAARDVFAQSEVTVDRELASVSDNPTVSGTPEDPRVTSSAHAVGAAIGLAMDSLGIAMAEIAAMSERRIDRLVNPLVSRLPAFLADPGGASSGFMIAQYTASSLVADNRRRAAPASLDGGVTSGLQEDHLTHSSTAALKLLAILDNAERILAIELLAATQAYELQAEPALRAPGTEALYRAVRAIVSRYGDDRPLADDMALAGGLIRGMAPPTAG